MLTTKLPKISCLLVTAKGRFDYFQRSYRCYIEQTYPNRELVIVNEGPVEYQQQIAEHVKGRSDIRLIFLDGKYTLGTLRNISIAVSQGEIFVQWDDDDFNMPERLFRQYHWLASSQKKACFLSSQLQYFFPTQELYLTNWAKYGGGNGQMKFSLIPGTIMAYKDGFEFFYPSRTHGEDSILATEICDTHQATLLAGAAHLNVYSFHGKNVYDVNHHRYISQCRSCYAAEVFEMKREIIEALDYFNFAPEVKVVGRDGQAFLYQRA